MSIEQTDLTKFEPHFNGPDYVPALDFERLTGQISRIYNLMKDTKWRTLTEIEEDTGYPQASISAQLRHLRKERFGLHQVIKRRVEGKEKSGLFEYQLVVNPVCSIIYVEEVK